MSILIPRRLRRIGAVALLTALGLGGVTHAQQPPATPASQADLERRIAELEAIVRQLQQERQPRSKPHATEPGQAQDGGAAPAPTTEQVQAQTGPAPGAGAGATTGGGRPGPPPTGLETAVSRRQDATGPAGWSNAFFLQSEDKKYILRITGQLQSDYRSFLDGRDTTDIDSFLVRRARLGIEANVLQYYEFRLVPDFSNAQAPGVTASTRIQDAYINVHYWDCFQFETGKYKQPLSYEQLIQDRFVPTMERSMIDQLVPARDEGVMIHGQKLFDNRLDYAVSFSNGEINGDFDTNDRKDCVGRVVFRPFAGEDKPEWLRYLQVGISGSYGYEQQVPTATAASTTLPNTLRTPATIPWFRFNSIANVGTAAVPISNIVIADGQRTRYSPEVSYFFRGLGFAAQYYRQDQEFRTGIPGPIAAPQVNIPFTGYYVLATYLLTGEHRKTYSEYLEPLRPFDPHHPCVCCGAWELVARLSRLSVDQNVFTPIQVSAGGITRFVTLADPTLFSRAATEMTLGVNWYLNKWVRMQVNWEHSWFDEPVRLGPGPDGLLKHDDAILTRFQLIF